MRQASTTENRATASGAWGLLAGLVGSLCCIGPTAAVLMGLGASSTLAGLQVDHTLALAGGGALLLGGIGLALRRAPTCELRRAARWRRPALMLAAFALSYGLFGLLLPNLAARQEDTAVAAVPVRASAPALRRLTLTIEKMNCPPCAANIRGLLKRKSFVHSFVAETNIEQVTIDYDSRQITAHKLAALFHPHYGVTVLSDEALP
jgi:copper chaperone CopZ